ncbi:hypothetical protein ABID22_002172 [Pontibacter aydingkolensis]|uniref:Uncharacterized protein n=1 Tax=Pontibacter aydingkolensis TaxID=1911536 RepID=A0ABS7CV93_9BACT|nr:hypothetical protein [Pontibacter aydingkolensis]MBW7467781.1 hypothetical protein [Pontibacter aydingkolensis]
MEKPVNLIDVREESSNITYHPVAGIYRLNRQIPGHAYNSGCMRGNDRYQASGSVTVGIFDAYTKFSPDPKGYSEFITHNYGQEYERQHPSSSFPGKAEDGM